MAIERDTRAHPYVNIKSKNKPRKDTQTKKKYRCAHNHRDITI